MWVSVQKGHSTKRVKQVGAVLADGDAVVFARLKRRHGKRAAGGFRLDHERRAVVEDGVKVAGDEVRDEFGQARESEWLKAVAREIEWPEECLHVDAGRLAFGVEREEEEADSVEDQEVADGAGDGEDRRVGFVVDGAA